MNILGVLRFCGYFWVNSNGLGVISVILNFFMRSMYRMGIFIWVTKAPFSLSRFKVPVHPGLMIRDEP